MEYEVVCCFDYFVWMYLLDMQPEMQGKIDPSILASLPPSMQLDLLVQVNVIYKICSLLRREKNVRTTFKL